MGLLEKLSKVGSKVAESSKKMIGKEKIERERRKDIRVAKIGALNLPRQDLAALYKGTDTSQVILANLTDTKAPSPYKMPINELVDKIENNVPSEKICDYLMRTRRKDQADKLKAEIDQINKRYDSQIAEAEGKVSEANKTEEDMVNDVVNTLRILESKFDINEDYNESEYQKQTKLFLEGAISNLEDKFKHFSVSVQREVLTSSDSNERIDLIISVGDFRIGIEMKKSLDSTSTSQRLLGQIDRYIGLCDALIVLLVKKEYDMVSINMILEKAAQTGKIIRVVTPEKAF